VQSYIFLCQLANKNNFFSGQIKFILQKGWKNHTK